jgi:hypothetical protein
MREMGVSPEDFGAKGDVKRLSLTFTNASPSVTGGGSFTSADIGKLLIGYGAGAGGKDLATTITAVAGASSITVANAAGASGSKTAVYMTDDAAAWNLLATTVRGAGGVVPVRVSCTKLYGVGSRIDIGMLTLRVDSGTPGNLGRDGSYTTQGCGLIYAGKRGAHHISAAARASNVVTLTTADGIDLTGEYTVGDTVVVSGLVDSTYDSDCTLSAVTSSTVACTISGADGSTTPIFRDTSQANVDVSGFGSDLLYMHANIWSHLDGLALYGNTGRPPLNLIHLEQAGGDPTNNQYITFEHVTLGPKFLGDTGTSSLSYFNGWYWSLPNANNDQMIFRNIYARNGNVVLNNFESQGTFHYAEKVQCQGNNICLIASSEWEIHSSFNASNLIDIVLGNGSFATNPSVRAWYYEDEGSQQLVNLGSEAGGVNGEFRCYHCSQNTVPANTRLIDLAGSNTNVVYRFELDEYRDNSGLGTGTIVVRAANQCYAASSFRIDTNVANPNIILQGLTGGCADARSQIILRREYRNGGSTVPSSDSHQQLVGGASTSILPQQWDWPGALSDHYTTVKKLATPSNTHCGVVGTGGTTFFYKVAAVVNGLSGVLSAETTCSGPASSTSVNYTWVDFTPVVGAQKMRLWRGTVAATENQFCDYDVTSLTANGSSGQPSVRDNCTFTGGAPPTADEGTGSVAFDGSLVSTGVTQANLGTPANGRIIYCSDCTIANPCAGAGTGAIAKRLNGVWVCN